MRLTSHTPDTMRCLAVSPHLQPAVALVESAGCEVLPSWANGVLLLVPLTPEQIGEADDWSPQPHHIVVCDADIVPVCNALRDLPRGKGGRPKLRPEQKPDVQPLPAAPSSSSGGPHHAGDATALSSHDVEFSSAIGANLREAGLKLEKTFLTQARPLDSDVIS